MKRRRNRKANDIIREKEKTLQDQIIPSDTLGSYTGTPITYDGDLTPEQDADDL